MTCKDCLYYEMCKICNTFDECGDPVRYNICEWEECEYFTDKSEWVHLPCKIGDIVYYIYSNIILERKVARIIIEPFAEIGMSFVCYGGITFDMRDIGNNVFFTREEAENALKEINKK